MPIGHLRDFLNIFLNQFWITRFLKRAIAQRTLSLIKIDNIVQQIMLDIKSWLFNKWLYSKTAYILRWTTPKLKNENLVYKYSTFNWTRNHPRSFNIRKLKPTIFAQYVARTRLSICEKNGAKIDLRGFRRTATICVSNFQRKLKIQCAFYIVGGCATLNG